MLEAGPCDVVLLCVKAHSQPEVAEAVGALTSDGGTVVAAQNGIPWWYFHGFDGVLAGRRVEAVDPGGAVSAGIPPERVLGCVVYMGARMEAPGVVEARPEKGLILGEPSGADSERLRAVAAALEAAGFPVVRSDAIRRELWTKLMGNASMNLISLLTRAGLSSMCAHPGTRELAAELMREVVAVAGALGAAPEIDIEQRLAITERLGDHKTSTLQDLEAGKRLELDAIATAVIELADLTGTPVPALRSVTALADLQARTLGLR